MKQKICPKCGDRNPEHGHLCTNCGASLASAKIVEVVSEPIQKRCPFCQSKLKPNAVNCPECGAFLAKGTKPRTKHIAHSDYSQKDGSSTPAKHPPYGCIAIIALIVLLIALGIVGIQLVWRVDFVFVPIK